MSRFRRCYVVPDDMTGSLREEVSGTHLWYTDNSLGGADSDMIGAKRGQLLPTQARVALIGPGARHLDGPASNLRYLHTWGILQTVCTLSTT